MAADLHIHIIENDEVQKHVEQYLLVEYKKREQGRYYGYYDLFRLANDEKWYRRDELPQHAKSQIVEMKSIRLEYDEKVVFRTPSIWVGEVSWIKEIIPAPIAKISELIKGTADITEELIDQVGHILRTIENQTDYNMNDPDDVTEFLKTHKNKKAFCISW